MKKSSLWIVVLFVALLSIPLYYTAAPQDKSKDIPLASTTQNGVSVHLINYRLQAPTTKVFSCLDLPDNQDWIVYASLEFGSTLLNADTMAVVNPKDPETYQSRYRCYEFGFTTPIDPSTQDVKFFIEKISTSLPEAIDQEMCDLARTEIQSTQPDISFDCVIDQNGVAFKNTSTSGTISDEDLFQLINNALTETVDGPWVLTLRP